MSHSIEAALLAAFQDDDVDEVLINGASGAWAVAACGTRALPYPFASADAYYDWLLAFAESQDVRLDPVAGAAGGTWRDGAYRWHAVLPPMSRDGPLFSLRRHRFDDLGLDAFAGAKTEFARLRKAAIARGPLLIAGPTGSGKTTLLAALLRAVAGDERIVTIEALPELPVLSPFCVRLVGRAANLEGRGAIAPERLLAEALRLRPDRLVIGEIRSNEAQAFLAAARAGHGGVIATIHAGTAQDACTRLYSLAGVGRESMRDLPLTVAVLARGVPPRLVSVIGSVAA